MAVLTNKSIASTYKSVLSIGATTESALTSSIQQLTDGLGNGSPLSMSTTQIQFNAGSNTFKFPTTRGSSGEILKLADANGTLDWVADASGDVTKTGTIALNTIAVWNDNVDQLRSDTTMSINTNHTISLLQPNSVPTDLNSYNIGGGNIANVTGSRNVGFGKQNLNAVLAGSDNTAMGNGSLEKVTSGNSNTGFGSDALGNSTSGDFNTAVGSGALGDVLTGENNTAVGYNAGVNVSTGSGNTYIGKSAGLVDVGSNNIYIGEGSGSSVASGNNNVILGSNTGNTISATSNNIIISDGSGNNRIQVDSGGNVGIANDDPKVKLHIIDPNQNGSITDTIPSWWGQVIERSYSSGASSSALGLIGGTLANGAGGYLYLGFSDDVDNNYIGIDGNSMKFGVAGSPRLTITSGGDVEISNSVVPTLRLNNTDTSLGSQTLGSIEYYQNDASDQGVGTVSRINCVNESSFAGLGALTFETGTSTSITERMRITSGGNVGIGTTSPDQRLVVNGSIGLSYDGTNSYQGIKRTNVGNEYYAATTSTPTNEIHTFTGSSGAKKLTILEGGNVGIGTGSTAPQNNLTIQTATDVRVGIYGGAGYSGIQSISDNNNVWKSLRLDGSDIEFRIQNVPKLTISSGGSMGVGVTPENSTGTWRNLQFGGGNIVFRSSGNNGAFFGTNYLFKTDNSEVYKNAAATSRMYFDNDVVKIQQSGSGYAGNTIDWTTPLTISSGGLATFTPTGGNGTGAVNAIHLKNTGTVVNDGTSILFTAGTSVDGAAIKSTGKALNSSDLRFFTGGSAAANERLTISSGGSVAMAMQNFASNPSSTNYGVKLQTGTVGKTYWQSSVNATTSHYHYEFINPSGTCGYITTVGTTTTNYTSVSDYRLKENVTPITDALSRVNQLKPSRFNFIADADKTIIDGFIAHEVQDVIPLAISGEKDATKEDGTPDYQGIDQSKIVPLLTAAIQEQQTIIEDLKARIETLEG